MWNKNNIRQDCFWYRPWKDMSATIDQCDLAETAKCPCDDDCKWYITNAKVDEIIWTLQQYDKWQKDYNTVFANHYL